LAISRSLSFETLPPLLLEEYTQEEIDRFRGHIDDCIAEVKGELSFRQRALEEYARVGLTLAEDKGDGHAGAVLELQEERDEESVLAHYPLRLLFLNRANSSLASIFA